MYGHVVDVRAAVVHSLQYQASSPPILSAGTNTKTKTIEVSFSIKTETTGDGSRAKCRTIVHVKYTSDHALYQSNCSVVNQIKSQTFTHSV
jgi:hypothetical protein